MNLYQEVYNCLMQKHISTKQASVVALYNNWNASKFNRDGLDDGEILRIEIPGRPEKPDLVPPSKLKQRKLGSVLGRATLIHAIAHIEFNAINLALDAVYRFRNMPDDYVSDWLKVAFEESKHFSLLSNRLNELGYQYGDMDVHNGLWEMVLKTDHDVMIRMALVPRVLEARGLDVTPGMIKRLKDAGDVETVEILKIILRDEIGHVAIGSRWFKTCCEQRNLEPDQTFRQLLREFMGGSLRGPFHTEARLHAGFSQEEMDELVKMF